MNVLLSRALNSLPRIISSKYTLLLFVAVLGFAKAQAQCNPNVALTQTGTTCAGTDTLILTGTDSVIQISWYNDTVLVSTGTDTIYVPSTAGVYHAIVAAGSCADTTTGISVSPLVTPSISITALPGDTVCRNVPVTFSSIIADGSSSPLYQWVKNGAIAGTDTSYTDSIPTNGDIISALLISNAICRTQDTAFSNVVTLTVNPLPSANVQVQGSLHRCQGDSVRLTAATGNTYLWSNGDTSRIIHVSIAGSYDVTVTNSHGCTAVSNPDTLFLTPTVQPSVTISANTGDTICLNTQVTFYAQSTNGGSNPQFQWKINNVDVGNTATFIGTTLLDGDVIICVLRSNATCAVPRRDTSDAITMTVHSLPVGVIGGPSHICGGTSLVTASATGTGYSYQWSNLPDTTASVMVPPGTYDVTVTDQNGCSAATPPFTVTDVSSAQATIIQSGDSLYTGPSQFYQWYYNGTIIAGATGPVAPIGHSGLYQVATIDSNGCRSTSDMDTILIAGINDMTFLSGMKLYPNPSAGTFSMVWADQTAREVRIIDAMGNVIADDKDITTLRKQYDLGSVSAGIYYVQVSQGAVMKTIKLSIVR